MNTQSKIHFWLSVFHWLTAIINILAYLQTDKPLWAGVSLLNLFIAYIYLNAYLKIRSE